MNYSQPYSHIHVRTSVQVDYLTDLTDYLADCYWHIAKVYYLFEQAYLLLWIKLFFFSSGQMTESSLNKESAFLSLPCSSHLSKLGHTIINITLHGHPAVRQTSSTAICYRMSICTVTSLPGIDPVHLTNWDYFEDLK